MRLFSVIFKHRVWPSFIGLFYSLSLRLLQLFLQEKSDFPDREKEIITDKTQLPLETTFPSFRHFGTKFWFEKNECRHLNGSLGNYQDTIGRIMIFSQVSFINQSQCHHFLLCDEKPAFCRSETIKKLHIPSTMWFLRLVHLFVTYLFLH